MPHHNSKKPSSSLGKSNSTYTGKLTFDLSDAVLKSAVSSLPDEHRALAIENFKKKATTPQSSEILQELQQYKSPFSNQQRIKLLKHRVRDAHGGEIELAATLPNVAVLGPRVAKSADVGDDNDPTRLAASVKTPTGTFDDVGQTATHFAVFGADLLTSCVRRDQVLALSQGLLNASFGYLWRLTPALQTINVSNPFGSLVANLKAPQVSLTVVQPGAPLWYMNFDNVGELTLIQNNVYVFLSYW
jgi:hypothetical protein